MNKTPSPPPPSSSSSSRRVPHECLEQQQPTSCQAAGQYYVLLADITAHHTGYHKLVEAPVRFCSLNHSSSLQMAKGNKRITGGEGPSYAGGIRNALAIGAAEMLGTAFLVFLGCMSCVSGLSHGSLPAMQPAITFGFAVAAIIQMFGHISKAHLNPAITLAAVILRVCTWRMALVYIFSQVVGATLGYGLIKAVTPIKILTESSGNHGFCTTVPNEEISIPQAFLCEFVATAILVFVLCGSWDRRNSHLHDSVAIKFGLTISALAFAIGPYTGASMNPARSMGPAFWNWVWTHHWLYWAAPLSGSAAAAFCYRFVFEQSEEEIARIAAEVGEGAMVPLNPQPNTLHLESSPDENGTNLSYV